MSATAAPRYDDDLLLLSEKEAVRRHFDAANLRVLRRLLLFFAAAAGIYTVVFLAEVGAFAALLPALDLAAAVVLLRGVHRPLLHDHVRGSVAAVLLGQLLVFLLLHLLRGTAEGFGIWAAILPFALLWLRLDVVEAAVVAAAFVSLRVVAAVGAAIVSAAAAQAGLVTPWGVVAYAAELAALAAVALALTRRDRRRFLARWSVDVERNRERLRMKQELEHAREIQLSMLPRSSPASGWLDIAAVSLPATEVGGDYYDYFPGSDGRLAVVVGDVAGHGVASGLVLSGVRSGLTLLEEDMSAPEAVMTRLNRMVWRTAPRRMFMTMLLALFDRAGRRLTVACAGNPPMLRCSAAGALEELTPGSLPLGARADTSFVASSVMLEEADTLLLVTDGAAETTDGRGDQYGYERLASTFVELARAATAKEVRDALLADLWSFKGTAEQVDDVTMVVVRVRPGAAAGS